MAMIYNRVIATAGRPLSSMCLAPLRLTLTLPCLIVAALFWLAIGSSVASAASQPVTEGWEYRWGDSSIDANGGQKRPPWISGPPSISPQTRPTGMVVITCGTE